MLLLIRHKNAGESLCLPPTSTITSAYSPASLISLCCRFSRYDTLFLSAMLFSPPADTPPDACAMPLFRWRRRDTATTYRHVCHAHAASLLYSGHMLPPCALRLVAATRCHAAAALCCLRASALMPPCFRRCQHVAARDRLMLTPCHWLPSLLRCLFCR